MYTFDHCGKSDYVQEAFFSMGHPWAAAFVLGLSWKISEDQTID